MTKEETISNLKAYLDGDTAVGNIIPLRSILKSAIKYLSEPPLLSNLDEVAEDSSLKYSIKLEESGITASDSVHYRTGFKSGAEWMAGQGASFNTEVGRMIRDWPDDILDKFEMGDKVVVQIRKK